MRRVLLVALGVLTATAVQAQEPSEPERPAVTVPLPSGSGIFYYRSGTPGGVRIESQRGVTAPASVSPPAAAPPEPPQASRGREGVSRLDLLLMEQRILDALDRREPGRSDGLARGAPLARPAPLPSLPVAPEAAPPASPPDPAVAVPDTPAPAAPVPAAPVATPPTVFEVERSMLETGLFRTSAVHFEFARAALLPVSARTLGVIADVLTRYPDLRVEVGGHTDNVGSDAVNDALSQRRAGSVVAYLVGAGVSPARLAAVGYGERRPIAGNDSETGRALNRRVEFTVLNPEAARREIRRDNAAPGGLQEMIREEVRRQRDGS